MMSRYKMFFIMVANSLLRRRARLAIASPAVAVKIAADAYVIDAGNVYRVQDVGHDVVDGGFAVFAQESFVECDLNNATFFGQSLELGVGKVARVVA